MTTDHDARMMAHLLGLLEPHGIGADRLTIAYEDDLQDYDVLISGGELSDAQIAAIWEAMHLGGCPRFTDARNTDRWHEALRREGLKILKAQAAEARLRHPDIPRFDRATRTLLEFVHALEIWSGAEPGSTLTVTGDQAVLAQFNGPPPDFAAIQKHLVVKAILADEDIEVLQLIGMDSGADPEASHQPGTR